MEEIIKIIGIVGCSLGIIYFLVRFFYFGMSKSFKSEMQKVVKYKYFLLIKISDINENKEKRVSILLNIMLRGFYLLLISAMILTFIFTLSQTL